MPAFISPALKAYLTTNKAPTKGFDDPALDRWVAGSLGLAPFTAPNILANIIPWMNITATTKTVTIPRAQMNQFIINQPPGPVYLDYGIQGGTEVDSITVQLLH